MPNYSFKCTKCDLESEMIVSTHSKFLEAKCPQCGAPVEQTYTAMAFKINGYSHDNEYKGKSYYRDIGKEKRRSYSI